MDIKALVAYLIDKGEFENIATNPLAQFGTNGQLLGATVLPEVLQEENTYEEDDIKYRTVIASTGGRYSPVQLKGSGEMVGNMTVVLGDSDIGREFTGRDYDGMLRMLRRGGGDAAVTQEAAARLIGFSDTAVNQALVWYNEMQRWQAIVDGQVVRVGSNGIREVVQYPNPTGHRVSIAASDWSSDSNDPMDNIKTAVDLLRSKGYIPNRIITRTAVATAMQNNINIARRSGVNRVIPTGGGDVEFAGVVNRQLLNAWLASEELPPIETYDERYWTQSGHFPFLAEQSFVILCTTGRNVDIAPTLAPEDLQVAEDVLGYTGVGRAVGQPRPGRVIQTEVYTNKPPRVEFEGWQTSLPVIQEPEAFAVLTNVLGG